MGYYSLAYNRADIIGIPKAWSLEPRAKSLEEQAASGGLRSFSGIDTFCAVKTDLETALASIDYSQSAPFTIP